MSIVYIWEPKVPICTAVSHPMTGALRSEIRCCTRRHQWPTGAIEMNLKEDACCLRWDSGQHMNKKIFTLQYPFETLFHCNLTSLFLFLSFSFPLQGYIRARQVYAEPEPCGGLPQSGKLKTALSQLSLLFRQTTQLKGMVWPLMHCGNKGPTSSCTPFRTQVGCEWDLFATRERGKGASYPMGEARWRVLQRWEIRDILYLVVEDRPPCQEGVSGSNHSLGPSRPIIRFPTRSVIE